MSLQDILARIRDAERASGRAEGSVELVAVSKLQPESRVRSVLDQGHKLFGENRVQEASERWGPLRQEFPDVQLRLIGPLQSNKVKAALDLLDAIESLDREKLARRLADEIQVRGAAPSLLVQVNTGEEPQKAGVTPVQVADFVEQCRREYDLPITGLMAIPPAHEPPAAHFALLAKLAEQCGVEKLSMGMSADFETAIEFGATSVRVGSALFGARD